MRAVQVTRLDGPEAIEIVDVAEPVAAPHEVLIDVHRVGISFPDLLLSRGQYQLKPELPFTLGVDVAGTVVEDGNGFTAGQRVCAVVPYGGGAERIAVNVDFVFPLPDEMSLDEGAALPMNYLTAHFALVVRGQAQPGESILIHGAAGGVGTATIQTAKALGLTAIAVVSTPEKGEVAKAAGADHVVLIDGFKDEVKAITEGRGVDLVLDVVGGDVFTDSLRSLAPLGRLLVVGFAAGQGIPEVKVNRLLLNNIDVRGVGWGDYAMRRAGYLKQQWNEIVPLIETGSIKPPIGAVYPVEEFGQALLDLDARKAVGKLVVAIR
ncbi:NADPH:quinone oxidoreductase family protein [Nocardioides dubius]|uniref:NADPH:quinone oxidoreductase family protein n=1 Tax=Nocardioides dubius TaxID=317019 RepID=A0ABN1TUA9_9ACTN